MKNKIEKNIKELYKTKRLFCTKFGYKYKDFASKLRTVQNRIDWLNKFLAPLNLKVEIMSLHMDVEIENEFPVDNKQAIEDRAHAIGKRQGAKWMRDKVLGYDR